MAYEKALVAAGAVVHNFETFGSYQGDWWARVTLPDGRTGWINGSYGSCSGCDAFEAEFCYEEDKCEEHRYRFDRPSCAACESAKQAAETKLAAFGAGYLDGLLTQEEAEAAAAKNAEWDSEAHAMLEYIRANKADGSRTV